MRIRNTGFFFIFMRRVIILYYKMHAVCKRNNVLTVTLVQFNILKITYSGSSFQYRYRFSLFLPFTVPVLLPYCSLIYQIPYSFFKSLRYRYLPIYKWFTNQISIRASRSQKGSYGPLSKVEILVIIFWKNFRFLLLIVLIE